MLVFVVIIAEGQRNIPITYATRATGGKGEKASLPIRVNQAGMIPIIFAISMMTFPSVIAQFFSASASPALQGIADFILKFFLLPLSKSEIKDPDKSTALLNCV